MYYITILSWVIGMLFGAFGALWRESIPVPAVRDEMSAKVTQVLDLADGPLTREQG